MVERVSIVELSDEYLQCRAWGHSWDDNPTGEVDSVWFKRAYAVEMLRCTRCTMERFFYLDVDLRPFMRYYRKPPRYDTIVGEGKRPNVRGEMLSRSLILKGGVGRNGKRRRGGS